MKIYTITCHDVYNVGASLQAYALQAYLASLGHDAAILDYKPAYLSGHYRLWAVSNPRYDRPVVRQAYLLAKLPGRLRALQRKRVFDRFTAEHLTLTRRYASSDELKAAPPEADVYFAGSDQIWNPLFPNGRDAAFYLDFVRQGVRASYAASFAVEEFPAELCTVTEQYLQRLDRVSVREASGLPILASLGRPDGVAVLDPVFLPDKALWDALAKPPKNARPYLLVYDFERSSAVRQLAERIATARGLEIYSVFRVPYARRCFPSCGPQEFLGLVRDASFVLSNSFHATAFSAIFERDFGVVPRADRLNTRMRDFTALLGLPDRMLTPEGPLPAPIDWLPVRTRLSAAIADSKNYIDEVLRLAVK